MPYKIEKKPMFYVVERKRGAYSDKEHEFDFIAANSPEEAWFLIKKYWKELFDALPEEEKDPEDWYVDGFVCKAKWNKETFEIFIDTDTDWDDEYSFWKCEVYQLPVIHFQSLSKENE